MAARGASCVPIKGPAGALKIFIFFENVRGTFICPQLVAPHTPSLNLFAVSMIPKLEGGHDLPVLSRRSPRRNECAFFFVLKAVKGRELKIFV